MRFLVIAVLALSASFSFGKAKSYSKPKANPAAPTICELQQSDYSGVLMCDRSSGTCTIKMHILKCLASRKNDDYAIEVQKGETVNWKGDYKNGSPNCSASSNGCPRIKFSPFQPIVANICPNPSNDNPFTDDFSQDTYTPDKSSTVNQLSNDNHSCFKHVVSFEDGDSIDPHIIIGGPGNLKHNHKNHSQTQSGK